MLVDRKYAHIAHHLLIGADLARVCVQFNRAQIPLLVLKGAALMASVYSIDSARQMGDIDLLIHPEDLERAHQALKELGYEYVQETDTHKGPFRSEFTGERKYVRANSFSVDLHWHLVSVEWLLRLVNIDEQGIWERAVETEADEVKLLILSPVDQVLGLCLHLVSHHFAHPVGFQDIIQILRASPSFDWPVFLTRAGAWKMKAASYFILEAINRQGKEQTPAEVLAQLRPPAWRRWLVVRVADPFAASRGKLAYNRQRAYLLHVAIADRWVDVCSLVLWLMFPGRAWLKQRYRVKYAVQAWLVMFWHPWIVLWEGLRSLTAFFRK